MEAEPRLKIITDLLPRELQAYGLYIAGGVVCVGVVVVLFVLMFLARLVFGRRKSKLGGSSGLAEDMTTYPELKASSGDRQLRVEGVPVRIRLIVLAPAGTESEVDADDLPDILEKLVPGLGQIYKHDKPRVRVWPRQVSYQGFATHFHRNTLTGAEDGEQTRWVMVAGRAKIGKNQIMLGMAFQTVKPNTIGRRTVDAHEWANMLRVRVKD